MYTYSAFKLMRANFSSILGLRVKLGVNPANTHNDVASEICRTSGGATVADFGVAPRSRGTTTSTSSLLEIASKSQPSIMKSE